MILKAVNQNTGRWRMVEADTIEMGKMWLGMYGSKGESTTPALYEYSKDPTPSKDENPVARKTPILLAAGRNDDMLLDYVQMAPIYESEGKDRVQVNIAVIRKSDGDEQIVTFLSPAYLMNNAGKTIEKF